MTEINEDRRGSEKETNDHLAVEEVENITSHLIELGSDQLDSEPSSYITSLVPDSSSDHAIAFTSSMKNSQAAYCLTGKPRSPMRYSAKELFGILIDTGAAWGSTANEAQCLAYCHHVGEKPNIKTSRKTTCSFWIGKAESIGTAIVRFPIGKSILSFSVHIVDADIPILLSLKDMDKLVVVHFNNLHNRLEYPKSKQYTKVLRKNGHPFIVRNPLLQLFFPKTS